MPRVSQKQEMKKAKELAAQKAAAASQADAAATQVDAGATQVDAADKAKGKRSVNLSVEWAAKFPDKVNYEHRWKQTQATQFHPETGAPTAVKQVVHSEMKTAPVEIVDE